MYSLSLINSGAGGYRQTLYKKHPESMLKTAQNWSIGKRPYRIYPQKWGRQAEKYLQRDEPQIRNFAHNERESESVLPPRKARVSGQSAPSPVGVLYFAQTYSWLKYVLRGLSYMLFEDLQLSLLESLRGRVKNGHVTERRLAKLVGVSQPHMHNVLKGTRILSSDLADRIMNELHLSVFDLVDRTLLAHFLANKPSEKSETSFVRMLKGRLGPGHVWPATLDANVRMRIPAKQIATIDSPVVAQLAHDVRMQCFVDGDFALLDQSFHARCSIDSDGLYVIKQGSIGVLRRLRVVGRDAYIATDDTLHTPAAWQRISSECQFIQHVVRARAMLLPQERDWWG